VRPRKYLPMVISEPDTIYAKSVSKEVFFFLAFTDDTDLMVPIKSLLYFIKQYLTSHVSYERRLQ